MVKKINYEYINNNSKNTMIFLHGWGMDKSAFDELVHFFCNRYSILKMDFPGFGKSEEPNDYYDTYEYAYQTFLLIKELGIKECVIIGHSFGGRIAILLSSLFGLLINGVVLASSAGLNRFDLIKEFKVIKYKIVKKLCEWNVIKTSKLNKYGSGDYKALNDVMKKVFVRVVNQDLIYLLSKINVHTMLVWDKEDKATPYWICKKLHRYIKLSRIIIFKSGGHFTCFYNVNKFAQICFNMVSSDTNKAINGINK